MKSTILLAAFLTFTFATILNTSSAQAHGAIHDLMEDEIGPAFKVISGDLKAGRITAQTKLAGKTLVNAFGAMQSETPTTAVNGSGGERPITAEEVVLFQKMNADMLTLVQTLSGQLDADDMTSAKTTFAQIVAARKEAHERFKAD